MYMKKEKKLSLINRNKITFFILFLVFGFSGVNAQTNMFMGNAQHTGSYSSRELKRGVGTKWVFKTNGPIVGSPAMAGGKIYIGSWDSCMYAVSKAGEMIWKKKTGGKICSTPVIAGNKVFLISFDGFFYALDTTSGEEIWKFKTRGERRRGELGLYNYSPSNQMHYDSYDPYLSSAVVVDSLVVFGCGDSSVYCLNAKTGNMLWQYKTGHVNHSSPAYYNNKIYCGGFDCKLYALDIHTGTKIWNATVGHTGNDTYSGNVSSPSVSEGVVYIGSKDNYVAAFDAETGTQKFKYETPGIWVVSTPAISNGKVMAGNSGRNTIYAISAGKGTQIFNSHLETANYGSWTWTSAAVTGNVSYIGSANGRMYAVDTSGNILWRYRTKGCIENIHNLYKMDGTRNDAALSGLDFTKQEGNDKAILWTLESGGIFGNAVPENGVLYFGSGDGYLYAVTDNTSSFNLDKTVLNMGTLTKRGIGDTMVYVTNSGNYDDSVKVTFDSFYSIQDRMGLSIPSSLIEIKKGEKIAVNLTINTNEAVQNKLYTAYIIIESKNSPETNFFLKKIQWRFKEVSDLNESIMKEPQVFPNPFNKQVSFNYYLKKNSHIYLKIFNAEGMLLKELINEFQTAGIQTVNWTETEGLNSGIYFFILSSDEKIISGKIIKK